jgi:hypothetical protein
MLHVRLCFVSPWLAVWLAVIFTILFLVQCQREREKGEKETPYSIHIFLFSAREKERKETHLCQSKRNFLFVSSAILVAIENAIILSGRQEKGLAATAALVL